MLVDDPLTRGREISEQQCIGCHALGGEGGDAEDEAPDHTGFGSRAWILGMLLDPQGEHYFDDVGMEEEMKSQQRRGADVLAAIAEHLYAQAEEPQDPGDVDAALAARGGELLREKCLGCHLYRGEGDELGIGGPELWLYPSRTWIRRQIVTPDAPTQYGALNEMPSLGGEISEHDLDMVTAYLRLQRFAEPDWEPRAPPRDEDDERGGGDE
jgi:mono/diheme cytochrome c family protein